MDWFKLPETFDTELLTFFFFFFTLGPNRIISKSTDSYSTELWSKINSWVFSKLISVLMVWLSHLFASSANFTFSVAASIFSTIVTDIFFVCSTLICVLVLVTIASFLKSLESKYQLVDQDGNHGAFLSVATIRETYRRLPWLYTKPDLETVSWLNQWITTLWPSLQTIINKILITGSARDRRKRWTLPESRQLAGKSAKFSVILTSRRRLNNLRNSISNNLNTTRNGHSICFIIKALVDAVRILLIYLKQFIMDYIRSKLFTDKSTGSNRTDLDIARLLRKNVLPKVSTRSLGGTYEKVMSRKRVNRTKSAPGALKNFQGRLLGFRALRPDEKLRKRRLALAETLESLAIKSRNVEKVKVNRVRLGDSCPVISGVKLINNSPTTRDCSQELTSFDREQNLTFLTEFSLISGRNFVIRVDSLPLLGSIELRTLRLKVRLLIKLNYTQVQNNSLEVLTSGLDNELPKINYFQIAPLDVPEFDWFLQSNATADGNSKTLAGRIFTSRRLLSILNHTYLKYISYNIVLLLLRWFDSFDIKVGPKLYLKSLV